jgi:hypothetical protein
MTVVVAMYGKPQVKVAVIPAPAVPTKPAEKPLPAQATTPAPPPNEPTTEAVPLEENNEPIAVSEPTNEVASYAQPAAIKRIQLVTQGVATWSTTVVISGVMAAGILWIIYRGHQLKRLFLAGESFVLHHVHLDLGLLAIIYLGWTLLSSSGVVR